MKRLGFVGLGHMGGALARRLLGSFELAVWDLRADAIARVASHGARPAAGPRALAAACDMVLTCLPTSAEVRDVLFGAEGMVPALRLGMVVVDMTTGDPQATRDMAGRLRPAGIELIDAPVAGSLKSVEAGTIAIMVGAPAETFERCRPVFSTISSNVFHTGAVGTGQVMKLVNNLVSAGNRAVLFEALAMGVKNGLSLETCAAVINKGSGRSHATEIVLPKLLEGDFAPTFTLGLMHKDVRLGTALGLESACAMPVANLVRELLQAAINEQGAESDVNSFVRLFEHLAGARVVRP